MLVHIPYMYMYFKLHITLYLNVYLISSVLSLLSAAARPKLPQLLCLKTRSGETINLTLRVGNKFRPFGHILLDDSDGTKTDQIVMQYHWVGSEVTLEILKRWIRGEGKQPVTWKTLTDALSAIGLTELAKSILESL